MSTIIQILKSNYDYWHAKKCAGGQSVSVTATYPTFWKPFSNTVERQVPPFVYKLTDYLLKDILSLNFHISKIMIQDSASRANVSSIYNVHSFRAPNFETMHPILDSHSGSYSPDYSPFYSTPPCVNYRRRWDPSSRITLLKRTKDRRTVSTEKRFPYTLDVLITSPWWTPSARSVQTRSWQLKPLFVILPE